LTIIGEVLGQPADQMRNPVNADYLCPFLNSTCVKRSHSGHRTDVPYPVCSVWRQNKLVCVCPKRFFEIEFLNDVVQHCWISDTPPVNPRYAYEVTMEDFGCVDFVIADVGPNGGIKDFISVELQAVDLTGSVYPAYEALINNHDLAERPSYGVNWANVRKRYVAQLITKGFFHHHWQSRIVSVIQASLYDEFRKAIQFDELDPKNRKSNIVFMTYDFADVVEDGVTRHTLKFVKAIGTSHHSLMMSALYRTPPSRDVFCRKIEERFE
jgi:hypothetical protein